MHAYKYLGQYYSYKQQLSDLKDKIAELEEQVDSVMSANDGMPRGNRTTSRVEELAVRLADDINRLSELQLEAYHKLTEIYSVIAKVKDPKAQEVLRLYFIDLHSVPEIAELTNYCERQIYRYRDRGVEEVERILWEKN